MTIGAPPAEPVEGTEPAGVTTNYIDDGKIYFSGGITSKGYGSVLTSIARNIIFHTGPRPASAIVLNGNNQVIADPPILPGSAGILPASGTAGVPPALSAMQAPLQEPAGSRRSQVLPNGESFVRAEKARTVTAGGYAVHLSPGTAALVTTNGGIVKVRTLYGTADVGATPGVAREMHGIAPSDVHIAAGHELILADDGDQIRAAQDDKIARRKVRTSKLGDGRAVMTSEVSLVSLLQNSATLKQLLSSSDPSERALARKSIKMAACLMQVTSARGAYSSR